MSAQSGLPIAALALLVAARVGGVTVTGPAVPAVNQTPEQRAIGAILHNSDPRIPGAEHPLPLAASWSMGLTPFGFTPAWQIEQIRRGQYLLPWFWLGAPPAAPAKDPGYATVFDAIYYGSAIGYLARHGLPLTFDMPPWEILLPQVSAVYAKKTDSGGHPLDISPFGPIRPWYEAGRAWVRNPSVLELQRLYPNPPLVLFISDNESSKVTPDDLHAPYSVSASAQTIARRRAIGDAWIVRYKAMIDGMRDGLEAAGWRSHALFIGYDAFVTSAMGRWGGWGAYSLYVPGRTEPWPYAWDGASVSYYVHDWAPDADYIVWSPEVEAMNYVPVLAEVRRKQPDFWFEISTWDGQQPGQPSDKLLFYANRGQTYSPDRYGGMVQFGMWLLRPRVVRDFRGSEDDERIRFEAYYDRIMEAVARVHRDPVLRDFWRHGRLVQNRLGGHPYETALTPELASRPRWFLLDSPANPPRPWQLTTPLTVYSLALVRGQTPHREWLVYAFSPLQRSGVVTVQIPEGPEVKVRTAEQGAFTLIEEGNPLPLEREAIAR
jgi:hypothetical protein